MLIIYWKIEDCCRILTVFKYIWWNSSFHFIKMECDVKYTLMIAIQNCSHTLTNNTIYQHIFQMLLFLAKEKTIDANVVFRWLKSKNNYHMAVETNKFFELNRRTSKDLNIVSNIVFFSVKQLNVKDEREFTVKKGYFKTIKHLLSIFLNILIFIQWKKRINSLFSVLISI